ncbi:MAG: hypothetical protein KAI43_10375 [Candidatus Aureabacteria bacterium]|nr:hypothetical protein [Candidatus Auribacterota bacterium]
MAFPVFCDVIVKDSPLFSEDKIIGHIKKGTKLKIIDEIAGKYEVKIETNEVSIIGFIDKNAVLKQVNYQGLTTLNFWQERAWHRIADPVNNLPWLNPEMDKEYRLDVLNYSYSNSWNNKWYNTDNGFRFLFGSISKINLYNIGEVKTSIPLNDENVFKFKYFKEETLEAQRDYLEFSLFDKSFFDTGLYSFFTLNPSFNKQDIDLELGIGKSNSFFNYQFSIAFLDLYNNLTYRLSDGIEEEVYKQKPYALKGKVEWFPCEDIGLQIFGALTTNSEKKIIYLEEDNNHSRKTKAGYIGMSLNLIGDNLNIMPYITYQYEDEEIDTAVDDQNNYDMQNGLTTFGLLFNKELSVDWKIEADIKYILVQQKKDFLNEAFDYEDRDLLSRIVFNKKHSKKLTSDYGFIFSHRKTDEHSAFNFEADNYRLILGAEYKYTKNTYANIGISFDLDRNDDESVYDGGKLQLISIW